MEHQETPQSSAFDSFVVVGDWIEKHGGAAFFATRSQFDWFLKDKDVRKELIEAGALLPGRGRRETRVNVHELPKAVVAILRRRALERAA